MSDPLRELGALVAKRQDRALEERAVVGEVVRRTLAARVEPRAARRPRTVLLLAAALALVAVVLYIVIPKRLDPELALPAVTPSSLVATDEDRAHAFADGTTMLLSAGGRADITEVTADGGHVVLVQGNVRVSVPPNRGRRWAFVAGPYTVEVKGTRFDLAWAPATARFDLVMFDGSVRVSGPGADARLVVAGQSLTLLGSTVASAAPATALAPVDPPPPRLEPSSSPSAQLSAPRSATVERASWQPLALEGKYAEAVKLAEDAGFDSVVAKSSASELLLLGDACRFAGRSARASEAYDAVRKRHAGGLEARRALFSLGVLAFPGKAAIPFFEQYLSEAPGGPLAPEALGRILEIRHRAGELDAAKKLAGQYLAQYPKGAHARLAQSILDDAAP